MSKQTSKVHVFEFVLRLERHPCRQHRRRPIRRTSSTLSATTSTINNFLYKCQNLTCFHQNVGSTFPFVQIRFEALAAAAARGGSAGYEKYQRGAPSGHASTARPPMPGQHARQDLNRQETRNYISPPRQSPQTSPKKIQHHGLPRGKGGKQ